MQKIKINNITLNKIDSLIINKIEQLEFLENRLKYNDIIKRKRSFLNYYIDHQGMGMICKLFIINAIILRELYQ